MSLPKTMKAGQWDPAQKKVVINEVAVPTPGPQQMVVQITSASLCHTDLMAMDQSALTRPFTLGHEGVGRVAQLHPTAAGQGFAVGDAVGFLYILDCCFACEGCQVHNQLCTDGAPKMQGWGADGFFAEYALVDRRNAIHLPPSWSLQTSSVFFCAGITAFNAVDSCELKPGQWLAVVGAGGLGQLATQYGKAMGLRVLAVDVNDAALAACRAQGAEAVFNARTQAADYDYAEQIRARTQGGAHAVAVFSAAKAAYQDSIRLIRAGGLLMVIGLPDETLDISTMDLALGKYRIKSDNTGIPPRMQKAVDFSAAHGIAPAVELRTLDELPAMVQEMRDGRSSKRMAVVF